VLVAEARPRPYASGMVAHGWNIDEESPCPGRLLVRQVVSPSGGTHGLERGLLGGGGSPSTLLGPETTGELVPSGVGVGCFWIEYGSRGSCHTRRLAGSGGAGLPGGFVRCLRTA